MDDFRANPGNDPTHLRQRKPPLGERLKRMLGPAGVILVLVFTKLKLILGFLPVILKTGGTMLLSIGVYALMWGWWFALGFVLLIFVHELGHLVAAKRFGLKVGAPVFIPFMGAVIALKDAPKDAWMEACVGIGGPVFGALASGLCLALYPITGNLMFVALAYTGFFLNLFNLMPVGFLDGGRIVTALSPWLWVAGLAILGYMLYQQVHARGWAGMNFILLLVLVSSLPRLFSLFRERTEEEKRYFEVTPGRRLVMGISYFGLAAALVVGMQFSYVVPER